MEQSPQSAVKAEDLEKLMPGVELRFGDQVVSVVDAHNDAEGVWVELSSGDMGYTDYGVEYELAHTE